MTIIVMGDRETVLGFRLVGLEGIEVTDRNTALSGLQMAIEQKACGLILVTDPVAQLVRDAFDARAYGTGFPLVLEIPNGMGPAPSRQDIHAIVAKGIGVSL